jgi:hypothetical protein
MFEILSCETILEVSEITWKQTYLESEVNEPYFCVYSQLELKSA